MALLSQVLADLQQKPVPIPPEVLRQRPDQAETGQIALVAFRRECSNTCTAAPTLSVFQTTHGIAEQIGEFEDVSIYGDPIVNVVSEFGGPRPAWALLAYVDQSLGKSPTVNEDILQLFNDREKAELLDLIFATGAFEETTLENPEEINPEAEPNLLRRLAYLLAAYFETRSNFTRSQILFSANRGSGFRAQPAPFGPNFPEQNFRTVTLFQLLGL